MEAASPARMGEENMRTSIVDTFYRLDDTCNATKIDYIDILAANSTSLGTREGHFQKTIACLKMLHFIHKNALHSLNFICKDKDTGHSFQP